MQYNLNEKVVIWLNLFDFLTIDKKHAILSCYDEPKDMFGSFLSDYEMFSRILTKEQFNQMASLLDEKIIDSEILNLDKDGIIVLTYLSKHYPTEFCNYSHYPIALYCKGDISLMDSYSIAIVGTRKITKYGVFATEKICSSLVDNGITIISGMATGVDTIAHKMALSKGGKTIAVLGSGFNNIFPKSNYELYQKICEKGLVITEYKPSMPPLAHNFPVRNRIIALLSKAVVLTEAGIKSGALYTVNYGLEYGKEIFAVPGNIDSFGSQGCNQVLKNCQAGLITCAEDIYKALRIDNNSKKVQKTVQLSIDEQVLIDAIGNDELSFDEIEALTKFDTKTLVRLLTTLELSGIIKKSAGNFYSRILND